MLWNFINSVAGWFREHSWVAWLMAGLSCLTVLASFVIVPWAVVRMPADYFAHRGRSQLPWEKLHPALRLALFVVKNLVGLLLLLIGIVLALPLVPGPGVFTILAGLALMDLPGKRRAERWFVSRPTIFAALNKMRLKHGHEPLEFPLEK